LSNDEIWTGDRSHEDSKHFEENFKKINYEKNKKIKKQITNQKALDNDINNVNYLFIWIK
jgi:hypothetical protein